MGIRVPPEFTVDLRKLTPKEFGQYAEQSDARLAQLESELGPRGLELLRD
jgi:hypothetical protein